MSDTAAAVVTNGEGSPTPAPVRSRRGRRILMLVLIVLILLLGLASYLLFRLSAPNRGASGEQADTGGLEWVRSIYGMSNKPSDQLDRAQAAVPAPDGAIWVTDSAHQALIRFTADGRYTNAIKGPKDLPLQAPSRFAIGSDGKFYVAETNSDVVRVLDSSGREAGSFGIPKPVSVAVSQDRIVVGAVSGFAILDLKGKPIKVFGARGQGEGQFDYVHGVAIGADGNIYVVDSFNNRISAYDRDGKRLWIVRTGTPTNNASMVDGKLTAKETSGTAGSQKGKLQLPLGLTIDGAGRLVVIDMFDCSLAVLDPKDGRLIGKYGVAGADDGQFFYPVSVSYDAQRDWFTVADQMNNRVQVVRIAGSTASGGAVSAARRALAGPARACLFPLLLLLAVIALWLITRRRNRRRVVPVEAEAQATGGTPA